MRKAFAAIFSLLTVAACDELRDPVSTAIFMSGNHTAVDVKRDLPSSAKDALRTLAGWGYLPDASLAKRASDRETSANRNDPRPELEFLPEIPYPEGVRDRRYLMRTFGDDYRSEGYGLVVDVDTNGQVTMAIGFKSFRLVF